MDIVSRMSVRTLQTVEKVVIRPVTCDEVVESKIGQEERRRCDTDYCTYGQSPSSIREYAVWI